jgi:hypothetical protein
VGNVIIIDALMAAACIGLWHACFAQYNRKKGAKAMQWVETACAHRGCITEQHWHGCSRVRARLAFAAHWFENARVTIQLRPRTLPLRWIYAILRRERETLTFEADLDCAPGIQLQVFRHRWLTHNHSQKPVGKREWELHRPGPVMLTTRDAWSEDLAPMVNTLMTSRGHNLLSVRFRAESPHLTATLPLEALRDEQAAASFLKVLRALAAGASAQKK